MDQAPFFPINQHLKQDNGCFHLLPREIDRKRSISTVADRFRVVSAEGGRKKKREKKKSGISHGREKEEEENLDFFLCRANCHPVSRVTQSVARSIACE
ncbi:hypothetical protein BHM03_00017615 [Ensete ventricosum]|nr:hypothetical protein BHM03_00017615 [Ensete ventricosum]